MSRRIFISTGEASGDAYGELLVRELRRLSPRVRIDGFGGRRMAAAGARVDGSLLRGSVMGLTGVFTHLKLFLSLLRRLRRRWSRRPPDAVVVIDFPGFNLRLARIAWRLGVPVYYYVCPQVWAWAPGRLLTMRAILRRTFPILPFEEPLHRAFGINASFVGHPLLEIMPRHVASRSRAFKAAGFDPRRPLLAVLPGSREEELRRHLPVLLEAAGTVLAWRRNVQVAFISAPGMEGSLNAAIGGRAWGRGARVLADADYAVRAAADFAWTASGTATLELGLLGVPQIVIYRWQWLNWEIARRVVKLPYVSLVNLILRREVISEYHQGAATPAALVEATRRRLGVRSARGKARSNARELRRLLAPSRGTASAAVARAVMADLGG